MQIKEKLKELRKSKGFTQEEMAKELSCNRQKIADWERGKSTPSADDLILLSKIFEVSTDYLLGLSNIKTTDDDLIFVAKYLDIDETTCLKIHNTDFDEHTKLFINYLFGNERLFKELDSYFSSCVLGWLYKSDYRFIPIKHRYSYIYDDDLLRKYNFASLIDVLPKVQHRYLLSLKDNKKAVDQITFELISNYIDLSALYQDIKPYLEDCNYVPEKVLNAPNVTDNELLLTEFNDLISEEQAIKEYRKMMDFKVETYAKILNKKGVNSNGNNTQTK